MSASRVPWRVLAVTAAVATVALIGGYAWASVMTTHANAVQSSDLITGTPGPVTNLDLGAGVTLAPGYDPSGSCANSGTLNGSPTSTPANVTFSFGLNGSCSPYDFTENVTVVTSSTLSTAVDTFEIFVTFESSAGLGGSGSGVLEQRATTFLLGVNTSDGSNGGNALTLSIDFGSGIVPQEITNLQIVVSEQLAPNGQLPVGWNLLQN
jgi:hypothetical protein